MADADLVITGTVLTVDDARPPAKALAVADLDVRATYLAGRQVHAQ
jgi:predicted amidohydrolase YtcJ